MTFIFISLILQNFSGKFTFRQESSLGSAPLPSKIVLVRLFVDAMQVLDTFQYLQINLILTPLPFTFFIVEDISLKMEAFIIPWVLGNLFTAKLIQISPTVDHNVSRHYGLCCHSLQ